MRRLTAGEGRVRLFTPDADDTAAAVGNAGVDVVATVTLILWVEEVCGDLLRPALEDGEASVGARVAVDHTGPAREARPVSVEARITAVDGRRITFAVAASQDGQEVMKGEHHRVVVPLAQFLEGSGGSRSVPPATGERVSFWFDVISPWSYLASLTIAGLARRRGVGVDWRPLHLGNLMNAVDGMRPMEQNPRRRAWYLQDIEDRMAAAGLPYHPHAGQPMRPSRALRCMAHAADMGLAEPFVEQVMRDYWAKGADITDPDVLQEMADRVNLGPRPMAEIASDPHYREVIAANTREAAEAGLFGVPAFIFRGKLYFGSDHMDMLDAAMALPAETS
ncbi:MAG: DsbA family protein [bacterium]|nr:DsbA family protein [bacterium]